MGPVPTVAENARHGRPCPDKVDALDTTEEDTRLREALLGVDESTVRMSNTKLWAKVASESGLRRSPTALALYRQWLSFRDAAGSTPISVTAIAAADLGKITAATPTTVNAAAASLAYAALADASAPTTTTAAAATAPLADVNAAAVATATAAAPAFLVDSALTDAPVTITASVGASVVTATATLVDAPAVIGLSRSPLE